MKKNYRTVKKLAAQGDVLFRRVDTIPATHKRDATPGPVIVAHSETGHHHAIDAAAGVVPFRDPSDGLVCYLQIDAAYADVVHHRSFDTHKTLRLTTGLWEARRQREYTPEGWRVVAD